MKKKGGWVRNLKEIKKNKNKNVNLNPFKKIKKRKNPSFDSGWVKIKKADPALLPYNWSTDKTKGCTFPGTHSW